MPVGYQQQKVVFAEPKPVPKLYRAIVLKSVQVVLLSEFSESSDKLKMDESDILNVANLQVH